MRHRLIDQLYEQIDKTSRELLDREAELVIVVAPETKEETLKITTSNRDLLELLVRLHNESLAFKEEVTSISREIQELPSEYLKEIATFNQALSAAWNQARRHNGWVSMFFAANCLLVDSEPLVKTAKEELGNHGYEIAHAMADLVRRLWELLDTAHPLVRELLKKKDIPYPFQTSRELLVTILRTDEDKRFMDKTSNHHHIDTPRWGELWDFIKQRDSISKGDLGELVRLIKPVFPKGSTTPRYVFNPNEEPDQWFDVVIRICHHEAPRHKRLKKKLNNFYREIEEFASVMSDCAKARTNKGKVFPSVTWHNGEPTVAGRRGSRSSVKNRYKT